MPSRKKDKKFQEVREAYEKLIENKRREIDYKVYFGVSEDEITGLNQEIVENSASSDLKNLFSSEEIQELINKEFGEIWDVLKAKFADDDDFNKYKGEITGLQDIKIKWRGVGGRPGRF